MINKLWTILIVISSMYLMINGKFDVLNTQILNSGKVTLDLIMQIFPLIALWLGIMNIATVPILIKLFPEIPKDSEVFGYISSNIIANLFGLGNAATPFGIKAMEVMQKLNTNKEEASRSMITFLIINTCGFTMIPTTIISLRMFHKSTNPSSIILPCIIVSFISLVFGLVIDRLWAKK